MPESSSVSSAIGEIIEASASRFVAQCPRSRLHQPPALGAFVKVLPPGTRSPLVKSTSASASDLPRSAAPGVFSSARMEEDEDPFADPPIAPASHARLSAAVPEHTLYALVCASSTGSADLGRRASAYGLEEDALEREQPQIFDLLATEFVAVPFGYMSGGRVRPGLPPLPPRLHAFVEACDCDETRALSETPDFVRQLLSTSAEVPPDELLSACLSHAYECHDREFAFLVCAGKQLAVLLRDDPERLAAILRKLQP